MNGVCAIADIRELASVPANYVILMLQGGASLQFSMVPMNCWAPAATSRLRRHGLVGEKAFKEGTHVGMVNVAASTRRDNDSRIPTQGELALTSRPRTSTSRATTRSRHGMGGAANVVWRRASCQDASLTYFSGPIDVTRFGLIYAGAPKKLGSSGVTLVIVREDLCTLAG